MWLHLFRCWRGTGDVDVAKKGEWHGLAHNHLHSHTSMFQHSNLLTWSSKYWTMISCPEAAASISGVKPEPGSLCMREESWKSQKCEQIVIFLLMVFLEQIKTLTWHWRQHYYPAGTWPSVGGLCLCSGTERSSLQSPSTPNRPLAFWVLKWKKKKKKRKKKCWMFTIKFKAQKECWI